MSFRVEPEKALLIKWHQTEKQFERIHLDFAGPFKGHMFLICIDAHSKWPEVFIMNTDATSTIEALREVFARFGLPSQIVTDNGAQFTSKEFAVFCMKNKIKHSTSPAFHPSTNSAAENFVKTLKTALAKLMKDPKNKSASIKTLLNRFLLAYRTTSHCVTGETPAKLMFSRNVRTLIDLIKPAFKKRQIESQQEQYKGTRDTFFNEGDSVMARDYRTLNKKTWAPAVIAEVLGSRTYPVKLRTVISYEDKEKLQSAPSVIQNNVKKPLQDGTNKPSSACSNSNKAVIAPRNSKSTSRLPISLNERNRNEKEKSETITSEKAVANASQNNNIHSDITLQEQSAEGLMSLLRELGMAYQHFQKYGFMNVKIRAVRRHATPLPPVELDTPPPPNI
ncbi:PREDICTED: uncharacterized protein K02A2.6-like [Cyphomyrmex costatus]|uniref:uncharacterized protein K02A2.6-like n=1 Tax=Cyphomyrmex costatus TaxID=456900 RepID=UPI0008523A9B|nr:PREDICTED: uncharacterized protein K02A2.6-like [Cyphomyrmex costatus]